jgi:hypothetical protein
MEPIASQYAIILYDPELRSALAKQRQPRQVGLESETATQIVRPFCSVALRVRLLMTRFGAARPMAVSERPVAQ